MVLVTSFHNDTKSNNSELICTTKFARIYKFDSKYAIKCIDLDNCIPPHEPRFELSILKKLTSQNGSHQNVIKLIEFCETRSTNELELFFPWYPLTLQKFMNDHWKLKKDNHNGTKRRFNPYYNLGIEKQFYNDISNSNINEGNECNKLEYINTLDVNKYCLDFFIQLLEGLSFIHKQGIIHRDIKPENILVQIKEPINLVIADFGISYDTKNSKQLIQEPLDHKITDISTSFYKAPELLFSCKNYSMAVDVWSLMVVITQWFQSKGKYPTVPAIFDNGSNILEDGNGSDIRLILSIFEKLGIPSVEEWQEVKMYGSIDAFVGLFGETGNGQYLFNLSIEEQQSKILGYLPRMNEILDIHLRLTMINCILRMMRLQSDERWHCSELLREIKKNLKDNNTK